jgi:hypothetical protein
MYKCSWNSCEKAYGTLNHLNAHVTMQSHGQKRTPEGMRTPTIVGCCNERDSIPHSHTDAGWVVVESHSIVHCFDFKRAKCLAS